MKRLRFHSELRASAEEVWNTVVTTGGIEREMRPLLRMTAPEGIDDLRKLERREDRPMFTSRLLALGFLPVGTTRLRITELEEDARKGRYRFVENSKMTAMHAWRHEREVLTSDGGCELTDRLEFEPAIAPGVVAMLVKRFFDHRHRKLTDMFG